MHKQHVMRPKIGEWFPSLKKNRENGYLDIINIHIEEQYLRVCLS